MADRVFTIFHLNLVSIPQLTFETYRGSREDWLRHVLSQGFKCPHHGGSEIHWVPLANEGESVFGLLQKTQKHQKHRPPTAGGEEVIEDEWQGAYVLIDPTHHDEGQRVAVENDVVGAPTSLLKSLVRTINARPDKPYHIEIEPLFNANEFWSFAEDHGGLMRYVNFDFVVPNMWTPYNDLEEDLRDTGKETGAQRVKVGFQSDDGVIAESPRIRRGVDYAERGAGTLSAKAMDGARFKSTTSAKTTMIPITLGVAAGVAIATMRDRILGRGKNRTLDSARPFGGDTDGS